MKEKLINDVIQAMMPHLNCNQIKMLNDVLVSAFADMLPVFMQLLSFSAENPTIPPALILFIERLLPP